MGVEALAQPRIPAGDIQRLEDAVDFGQAWDYTMDVEDALWLSNRDKANILDFVRKASAAIAESRLPECKWWQRKNCRRI